MKVIPKFSFGIDFTLHAWTGEGHTVFRMKLLYAVLAFYLEKSDLEGQNFVNQWFEMQSIKMEKEEELLCKW